MARIRTIKPGFFTSEDVAALSLRARLTWIGLWTYVDDEGRGKANPRLVKAALWPLDDVPDTDDVADLLRELADHGRIRFYEVAGVAYFEVVNWSEHQRISHPTKSSLPAPEGSRIIPEDDGAIRLGREGKGKEGRARANARPAPNCPAHPQGTTKPCRACGDARRAHDAWRETVPGLPTVDEALNPELCPHEFRRGACPTCRRGGAA